MGRPVLGLLRRLLLLPALMELVANSLIVHLGECNLLKPIVMTLDFQGVRNYCLHPVVMAVNFDTVDHSRLACLRRNLGEDLVVVPRDLEVTNCIPGADLDLAIVAPEDTVISRFHESHTDRVVGNID